MFRHERLPPGRLPDVPSGRRTSTGCCESGRKPKTLDKSARSALDCFLSIAESERLCYWSDAHRLQTYASSDAALQSILTESLESNLPHLLRGVRSGLKAYITAGNDAAIYASHHLHEFMTGRAERGEAWRELGRELAEEHPVEFARWRDRRPWSMLRECLDSVDQVERLLGEFGPDPLYLSFTAFGTLALPTVLRVTAGHKAVARPARTIIELRNRLILEPTPWLKDSAWLKQVSAEEDAFGLFSGFGHAHVPPLMMAGEDLASMLVLYLPYLEASARIDADLRMSALSVPGVVLVEGRTGANPGAQGYLARWNLPRNAEQFLSRWINNEFSVIP